MLAAGPGELGNTRTTTGNSVIIESCPTGSNVVGGGAELLPSDANVRGILESSYPNPANNGGTVSQWLVTAEVTATSPSPSATLIVVEWVNCQ